MALLADHLRDLRGALRADADHLGQPVRRRGDDLERVLAELLDDPLRERRPDPGEDFRAEKLLDPGGGLGRDHLV
ncbi:MAG TPA: hypothetical protein VMJ10_24220, partial [Kofleriaceae bacterium]|nr:hypothetical protein [Kofleriaceae bacterium]